VTTLESTTERLEAALRRLAVEAGDLFDELLAGGAELPFEIEPTDDGPLPMYQYAPKTGEFIQLHAVELRRLEAFVEVRELAGENAAIGFLVGLWDGRSEFSLVEDHLQGAIGAVLATLSGEGEKRTGVGEVIVPLIGFHMPADEVELDGVRIIRADTVDDVPVEAVDATRPGRKGKSGFLAQVHCAAASVAPAAAVSDDLRRALRTLRLFTHGAVGLASHGWVRRVDGWERFGTGANRPRHGGYRLTGNEVSDLEDFSRTLASRGAHLPALAWAISRFDLGAERPSLIEALSDYLLALRGLLEGGGPARAALGTRVAALVSEGEDREATRQSVEHALAIERKLMSGGRFVPAADSKPLDAIAGVEDLLRRILRGMIAGELGGDLRTSADQILLSDGLLAGETAVSGGETAEWRIPEPLGDEIPEPVGDEINVLGEEEDSGTVTMPPEPETTPSEQPTTRILVDHVELPTLMADERPTSVPEQSKEADWFSAGDGEVDWPAFASPRRENRDDGNGERPSETSDRIRHLFPVPDATDWDVGELRYERQKRSGRR
jgi:hypothetical protein